ncbi:MAG: signal peptidase II [Ignavibacteriaceae bacterium]|nr:signal peptidase II [Ignavibacteriaceae bacterium]
MKVLYATLFVVIADQVSKIWIKGFNFPLLNLKHEGMQIGQKIPVLGDFFRITFIENPGLAFGIDINSAIKLWISIFSLVASIALIIYLYIVRKENFGFRFSLALILGGAIGNFIDRAFYGIFYGYAPLFYGKVVDFLDFDFFNLTLFGRNYDRFAIFNIADSAVTVGIILLLFLYKEHDKKVDSKETECETLAPNIAPNKEVLQNYNVSNADTENDISKKEDDETNKGKTPSL